MPIGMKLLMTGSMPKGLPTSEVNEKDLDSKKHNLCEKVFGVLGRVEHRRAQP
jgi:hypothetical protein